jgi:predicted GIY-YIG superfamily endonuclease
MYDVYILQNEAATFTYVGLTRDIQRRWATFTKSRKMVQ